MKFSSMLKIDNPRIGDRQKWVPAGQQMSGLGHFSGTFRSFVPSPPALSPRAESVFHLKFRRPQTTSPLLQPRHNVSPFTLRNYLRAHALIVFNARRLP